VATFHNYVLDPGMRAHGTLLQRLHYATDLRLFTRRSLARATAVTAVSRATADLVRDDLGYAGTLHVIPNSVDGDRFSPATSKNERRRARVLFCGTPSRRKGFHWLDAVAAGIGDVADLVCATGGRDAPQGETRHLTLLGAVRPEAMPDLYRSVDAFVLPSVREGMSLALLEAMASGLPVVAWRVPSAVELLGEDEGGLLATLGDVDGLVERLRWLLGRRDKAAAMGARNRAHAVARHSPRLMADRYASLFDSLESGKRR
jgi:glycosyltransferase involved in cell wall biosynthesis